MKSHVMTIITLLIDEGTAEQKKRKKEERNYIKKEKAFKNTILIVHFFFPLIWFFSYLRIHMSFSPNEGKKQKKSFLGFPFSIPM